MAENIGLFTLGSVIGVIGIVTAQPLWLIVLTAFLLGAASYSGKLLVMEIRKRFKKRIK